jgi:hypothetical protein
MIELSGPGHSNSSGETACQFLDQSEQSSNCDDAAKKCSKINDDVHFSDEFVHKEAVGD